VKDNSMDGFGQSADRPHAERSDRRARKPPASGGAVQIVVTPGSGEGRALATARRLAARLKRRGHVVDVHAFADLDALARGTETCPPGASSIVCIGGDATQSAVARAAIRCDTPLVPVPNGFGNVFARSLGYSPHTAAVARLLDKGEVRRVDVGVVERESGDEVFLSHRSYGLLEQIQQVAERGRNQPRHRLLRYAWYYGVAHRFLFRTRLASFQVAVDGAPVSDDAVLVTVANVETYHGFLTLTPAASPIDGLFDVFVIPRASKLGVLCRLLALMFRLPGRWRGVVVYRGRRVVVTTPWRREVLTVARRALPLRVSPTAIAALERRTVDDAPTIEVPSRRRPATTAPPTSA
jgi:diacylglycerol kinase (ATP)